MVMLRQVTLVAAVAALAMMSSACSDDTSDPAEGLYGDWRTSYDGYSVVFEPDGFWTVARGADQQPFDTGMFTFDGTTLTVDTSEGSEGCEAGQTGTYEVTFVGDETAELEPVDDECAARRTDFRSGLTRSGN